jgi:hypothetical protein
VPRLLMIHYDVAHPGIGVLQRMSLLLRQLRIFHSGKNIIKLRFEPLTFSAKHFDLRLLFPLPQWKFTRYAAYLAMSSFLPNPRIPCFWPTFRKATIAASR